MHRPVLILIVLAGLALRAAGQQVEVEEYVLENGMTFLLLPREQEPNSISCGWIAKVGSVNEHLGITGLSHFFEHMLFKGTTTIGTRDAEADAEFVARQNALNNRLNRLVWEGQYQRYFRGEIDDPWDPAHDTDEMRALRAELRRLREAHGETIVRNEFSRIYTEAGATGLNAATSHDWTIFFVTVPSNKIELWAWMESDRLDDPVFREFYAEREVVHEERRMILESSPTGALDEQFDAMFWRTSSYAWPVIGLPSDIRSYTRAQFDAYFDVYYRPGNLVGVLVGDFDPETVKPLLREYFGRLERGGQAPPPIVTLQSPQVAEMRLNGECDCQPQIEVRYHTVPFDHRDSFALEIMAELLNGRTGRLYRAMVEGSKIASSVAAGQDSRKYAGAFAFTGAVKGDAAPEDLERAWYAQLQRLRDGTIPEDELQKVKNRITAETARRLQRNDRLYFELAIYEALDGWEYINEAPTKLMAVTAADVRRVAKTYFDKSNRCVAIYTRRPGGATPEKDPLADLPPVVRRRFEQTLQRLLDGGPRELRRAIAGLEDAAANAPNEVKPAMEYMLDRLRERLAELEAEGDEP
ncbi:MAG: pitrilysin family protein [Planctomycetota bacterium]|nr:pitrilysin family protein [Planctomycetota bacterium]